MSIQVVETPQVTALRTLILKQLGGDSTQQREVVQASFRAIFALQDALTLNKEWIWSVPSVLHARNDAYVLYEPPLAVHFRLIDLGKNRHYRSRI